MQISTWSAALIFSSAAAAATATAPSAGTPADRAVDLACAERGEMVERLKEGFGEAQTGLGLVNAAQVLEVWSSDETGTWTILMTDIDGQSCLVAAGESWKNVPASTAVKGKPA